MEHLETPLRIKIKDLVDKLQKLECTLLGNTEDSWVMELLFEPGLHRCRLIEWMLSKLGCDIGKIFGPPSSTEERIKNLQSTLSQLGICWPDSVIEGTDEVKEQLKFWCQLIDIISLKYEIVANTSVTLTDETLLAVPERVYYSNMEMDSSILPSIRYFAGEFDRIETKCICAEFEEASSLINKICESGILKHLFKHDVQLVSPDVEREMENLSASKSETYNIPCLEELKKSAVKNPKVNVPEVIETLLKVPCGEDESDHFSELNQLEEKLLETSVDFTDAQSSFSNLHNDFKPLILNARTEPFTDVGPAFQKLECELEKLIQLKNSLSQMSISSSTLLKISSELEESHEDALSDEKYASILELVKDKN